MRLFPIKTSLAALLLLAPVAACPQQQQTTPAAQAALANLKAQQLIRQVESSYNSGVNNYRSGHLDAARLDFDFAVDALLTSGMDLRTESDLSAEFTRVTDAINSLEMAALKQGNGFSPRLEDAPLDAVGDETFSANPELVAKLRGELNVTSDLPLIINDQVAGYIGAFSQSESFRKHMAASLRRAGRFRGLIQNTLKEEGVPQDLIYLAVAESGFQPQVVNRKAGASGMWQFISSTGNTYGLIHNGYFDYRFDPEKSTRAYAKYIKTLYGMFGDWNLAMAAYDWGPGAVQKALARTGTTTYWDLYAAGAMPGETRAYVPKILAAVLMAKNPEVYGLDKLTPSPAVIYDTVPTNYAIDVRLIADVTNASTQEIVALNPALLRLTTPRDISFDLHIPPGTKLLYAERLKDIPEDRRATWRFHVVKPGETLDTIATTLHAHIADIAETNGITPSDPMTTGDELVVPVQSAASVAPQRYTTRYGDTLVTVADQFNISTDDLRQWNSLTSSTLRPGRTLYVAEPIRLAAAGHARSRRGGGGGGTRIVYRHGRRVRISTGDEGAPRSRGRSARGGSRSASRYAARGYSRSSARSSSRSASRSSSHSASHARASSARTGGKRSRRR